MKMSAKVALVTGGNRGIGFEVCKLLCKQLKMTNGTVILTARDKISGQNACHKLIADGYNARFIPLDVTSKESIQDAATKVKTEFEGLDILINNAGIMYSSSKAKDVPYAEQVERTLETNFFGILNVCESMFPLLRNNARVVNVTSRLGDMKLYGEEIRNKLCSKKLGKEGLVELMLQFLSKVQSSTHIEAGWPDQEPNSWVPSAYCVSKLAVTLLTRILANDCKIPGVLINCCCPGWCRTDLGGQNAQKSAEAGAVDILDVILQETNGGYWAARKLQLDTLPSK